MSAHFPLEAYLDAIGLHERPSLDAAGLERLVRAQIFSIPFENFDVLAGLPVSLEPGRIFQKLIGGGRGGYCFELNTLLRHALEAIGFNVRPLLSRVTYRRPAPGPRTHMNLLVDLKGDHWLVDAAFGGPGLTAPIPLIADAAIEMAGARFLMERELGGLHLKRRVGDEWVNLYVIHAEEIFPVDLETANFIASQWDSSPFRNIYMCMRPTEQTSIMLVGREMAELKHDMTPVSRKRLESQDELRAFAASQLRLNIPDDILARAYQKVRAGAAG